MKLLALALALTLSLMMLVLMVMATVAIVGEYERERRWFIARRRRARPGHAAKRPHLKATDQRGSDMPNDKTATPLFLTYVNEAGRKGWYWCEDGDRVREFAEEHRDAWKSYQMFALEPVEAWQASPE